MQLTKNFSLKEFTYSRTAEAKGITNEPGESQVANLKDLCVHLLQPLREASGVPLVISSGYRCPELNRLVGGSLTSDHMHGRAADIRTGGPLALLAWVLRLNLSFDQAIVYPGFLHLSYRNEATNRKQVITHKSFQ